MSLSYHIILNKQLTFFNKIQLVTLRTIEIRIQNIKKIEIKCAHYFARVNNGKQL